MGPAKPNAVAKTQTNLTHQKLDTTVRRLSYCVCDERTSSHGYIYVCVRRSLESN